jgi:hypothetical protein
MRAASFEGAAEFHKSILRKPLFGVECGPLWPKTPFDTYQRPFQANG